MSSVTVVTVAVLLLASCGDSQPAPRIKAPASIEMTSSAFSDEGPIPTKHTCDGEDAPPPLEWTSVPGAEAYAISLTDPDADEFVHWVLYDIPPAESGPVELPVLNSGGEGENGFGEVGYGGPCPPENDEPHRYVFTVYALGQEWEPTLDRGASLEEMLDAIECCVIAKGSLSATYDR
jgi:Raf kinase inhibitor-like YbhB/YbcL family protein